MTAAEREIAWADWNGLTDSQRAARWDQRPWQRRPPLRRQL